jgi:hypothetical protein
VAAVFLAVAGTIFLIPAAGWGTHHDLAILGGALLFGATAASLLPVAARVGPGRLAVNIGMRLLFTALLLTVVWTVQWRA